MHPLQGAWVRAAIEQAASAHAGRAWTAAAFTDLNDRASHPCGILHGKPFSVFAKLATDRGEQFEAELRGLTLLRARAGVLTPTPIGGGHVGVAEGSLLLFEALAERLPPSRGSKDWRAIGRVLATLHAVRADRFGLAEFDGYFGPFRQDNRSARRWSDFYAERRLLPNLRAAVDSGNLPTELAVAVERVVRRLPQLAGPEPRPSLLHGDAQQNNFVSTRAGAVVVDVAPYFGHPELDLALVDYFAPVPLELFHGYRELAPIDPGFGERRELWRLFGYLAVIALDGANPFGRRHVPILAEAVGRYR